ncbi:MAG: 4-oxalomesaconate tautomerase [Robiginitomaculum sp.]|nr:4-oxalomesaconate tautomerase [Robiginitomaculum sp.]
MQTAIPTTLMRGGTSKGLYFHKNALPAEAEIRNRVLLRIMGSPDMRQIDGVGGAHPLTSKVAIISPTMREGADIDYLFLQVTVDKAQVSDNQNCGNILAGVGPWAIENGLVDVSGATTPVRIHMVNTGSIAMAHIPTPNGFVTYEGDARIDGVPGTAAPILIDFLDVAGATCGALLPTGNVIDKINGLDVTCIDNGMPVVVLRACDFGLSGKETAEELENNTMLKQRIEKIRLALGPRMNLGDVSQKTVPKMTLISPPTRGGVINTRSFIPHRVHEAIGVLGAVSVATACVLPGSVAASAAKTKNTSSGAHRLDVEHPTGFFTVNMDIELGSGDIKIKHSALLRTARKLMGGDVYIPSHIWSGK